MARTLEKSKRFAGVFSRTEERVSKLGVISGDNLSKLKKFRKEELELYDSYFEDRQYDHLLDWDKACEDKNEYVPIRKRKPRIRYNLAKTLVSRVASKLIGDKVFPSFTIEDDPDTSEFLRAIIKSTYFKQKMLDPVKKALCSGSSFVRFRFVEGTVFIETYNSKFCYPEFKPNGELLRVVVQYIFEDENEKDEKGNPKKKWYKLELTESSDILYDTPEAKENQTPVFSVVEQVDHNLGYVQGEWFKTDDEMHSVDGYSLICDILPLIDDINYSISQSSTAISYNQDPQLTISNMDEEELDNLIRSSQKAWNLGREGEAKFLESSLNGVEVASTKRAELRQLIVDVVRVVMLDPEKIVGSAQSAKAMEVLHGPLIDLIEELRPQFEKTLLKMLLKMAITILQLNAAGIPTPVSIPEGYQPLSFDVTVSWPPIFPLTIEDLQKKVSLASSAAGASLISRESMTRWLAKDFGIENVEEEIQKIAAQPVVNPWGSF